jgi:nucleoside-diphosphate-sugar epimerase
MALLITGGSGFAGLALAEASLTAGEEVVVFAQTPPPPPLRKRIADPRLHFVIGDIRSSTDLKRALAVAPIDRVVHAAAITAGPRREADEPEQIIDINVGGTACLMAKLRDVDARVSRVIVMSSIAVYGFSDPAPNGHYREDESCPAPAALYGITKLAAEQTALRLGEVYGIDTRAVRLGPVYGPWEHRTGVRDAMSPHLQAIEIAASNGMALLPRRCPADWVYSRQAATGIRSVLDAPRLRHRVYNLGGGGITDLPAWCEAIAPFFPDFSWRLAEPSEQPNVVYAVPRDRPALDVARIRDDTGFEPSVDVPQAAADYARWIKVSGGVAQ